MSILFFIIKAYIIVLMFRYVATTQELNFNPIGKTVAMLTEPVFKKFRIAKEQSDRFIPMLIFTGVIIASLLQMLFTKSNIVLAFFAVISNFLLFFMLFFTVSILLGNFVNKPLMSHYVMFFYRLGFPWVKLTRTIIPISSNKIIYPAVLMVFFIYVCASFIIIVGIQAFSAGLNAVAPISALLFAVKSGLLGLIDLLYYLSWLIIARALMSWVSPDVRNPIVQLIYTLTEPVLAPFRRIIPSVGIFDFSALVAIVVLSIGTSVLQNLINTVL